MVRLARSSPADPGPHLLAMLRLARSRRVGPTTFHRLLAEHGSPEAALAALPGVAATAGVENYAPCTEAAALAEWRAGRGAGAVLLVPGRPGWPRALHGLEDAPPLLWALGDTGLLARQAVALVGARNASSLGLRMAARLAADLGAAGLVIVSGLARGIDAAAHDAALPTGTIAVLAGGIDVIYPPENTALARQIADVGLLLSEQPPGLQPQARHFPRRNRIVSGLSRALVVVEGAAKSGSLITARAAADQGREVMAVPGHPTDARADGCNALIREGAALVRGARDVLEALDSLPLSPTERMASHSSPAIHDISSPSSPARPAHGDLPRHRPAAPRAVDAAGATRAAGAGERTSSAAAGNGPPAAKEAAAALAARLLSLLGPSPVPEDQLIRDVGQSAREVGAALVALEMEGTVLRHPGAMVSRSA
ncbi:MAG: DNA-processing protein DprA [Rhodobacteraceae bacterium]|nr:DNA-processing protein DprA [Paracoccaceae bacterium]